MPGFTAAVCCRAGVPSTVRWPALMMPSVTVWARTCAPRPGWPIATTFVPGRGSAVATGRGASDSGASSTCKRARSNSRDRSRIERARAEFHVGNLYINRKITGALVGVQPFGGFKMSGSNAKAGGPDYLRLFMEMKTVAERWVT